MLLFFSFYKIYIYISISKKILFYLFLFVPNPFIHEPKNYNILRQPHVKASDFFVARKMTGYIGVYYSRTLHSRYNAGVALKM